MRFAVLVLATAIACKHSQESNGTEPQPGSARPKTPVTADRPGLAMEHVTLLHPEAVIETRLADMSGFASAIKAATEIVISYDKLHADALPSELDLVFVARPGGVHCWLVGPEGDVVVGELDASFTKLPQLAVHGGNVGAVAALVRVGSKPTERVPYVPAAWKAAAGKQGARIDDAIDAAWPH